MNQTSNYGLNQWEEQDRILREDFNADNAKIEAAIKDLETSTAQALAAAGNCKIMTGSYVGNGTFGSSNPNTLTFDFQPKIIFLHTHLASLGADTTPRHYILFHNIPASYAMDTGTRLVVSWSKNSVSWYFPDSNTNAPYYQFNNANTTYHYIAIG